jgi:hypothetical protein
MFQVDISQITDAGTFINWTVWTSWASAEDLRGEKQWGDSALNCHPGLSTNGIEVTPVSEDGNLPAVVVGTSGALRNTFIVDINSGAGVLSQNFGLQITGSVVSTDTQRPLLYWWQANSLYKTQIIAQRRTDYEDLGYKGAKFIQGLVLRANTYGADKSLVVTGDGVTQFAFTANHNGEQTIAYPNVANGWTPFIAELVQIQSSDMLDWLLLDWRFVFEPAPELATLWETQDTTFDFPGYGGVFDAVLAYQSTSSSVLRVWHGVAFEDYVIPSSGGVYTRFHKIFQAKKGLSYKFRWTSDAPARVFMRDVTVRVQPWGQPGGYQQVRPFGGPSRVVGAEI